MNLPLHLGWLGALEAGLIALAIGFVLHGLFHALQKRFAWKPGHDIGWACLAAVALGAGVDLWNLFYLGVVRLESPVYARIALSRIHDADGLGARVFMEIVGALGGVALGWMATQALARRHTR
ncbi:hypothetical protein QFW77_00845 [Luteimonas sp. RD2P54]|uniref:Transmembrane protein n=1 Tax=Luteimonas endophytica TaxID=3042023 RepID=A0ABT6J5N9_9GAMM|nr:hypothetical protein [Luteimonas endophytica]MDH5821543.1 hypothetical protein [Luteimonas endophytica]